MTSSEQIPEPDETHPDDRDLSAAVRRDERRARVMRMINSGMTQAAVAQRVGVSVATVRKDIKTVIDGHLGQSTEQYVGRQLSRITELRRAVYAGALQGDFDAFDRALKLEDREAKLLGLDAPARAVVHVSGEDFAATAAQLLSDMGVDAPDSIAGRRTQTYHNPDALPILDADTEDIVKDADKEVMRDDDWVV